MNQWHTVTVIELYCPFSYHVTPLPKVLHKPAYSLLPLSQASLLTMEVLKISLMCHAGPIDTPLSKNIWLLTDSQLVSDQSPKSHLGICFKAPHLVSVLLSLVM